MKIMSENKSNSFILLLVSLLMSCTNSPYLSSEFDCDVEKYSKLKVYSDINKNFRIDIPSNWKTELYYSDFESELFSADTTKQLTETYILDASFNSGRLTLDKEFYKKNDSVARLNDLTIINSGNQLFQEKPTYWNILEGSRNGFPYYQFNLMVKLSRNSYFKGYSEVYGDSAVYDRICKSITIFESIEFLE